VTADEVRGWPPYPRPRSRAQKGRTKGFVDFRRLEPAADLHGLRARGGGGGRHGADGRVRALRPGSLWVDGEKESRDRRRWPRRPGPGRRVRLSLARGAPHHDVVTTCAADG
jgi:hypothetical protein